MPVSINHTTSSYLPVTSPSKTSYRHHCSPSTYKSSYSTLSDKYDKYSYPSSRYSSYSRTSSLSDDSGLSITGTSCTRDRSSDSQESTISSRYSKVRSSSSSDSTSSALKSYSSSTLSRKSTPSSRYLTDLNDISVADIRLRFSSLPKTDSIRPTKLSESRSYSRSESLQPLALSSRKSALSTTHEQSSGPCDEDGNYTKDSAKSSPLRTASATAAAAPVGGLNGLKNIGNTCFLNTVVQCLSNTPQLKDFLVSNAYVSEINPDSRGALIKSFADLIKELWEGENKAINTSPFKAQIQRYAPRFMGYQQQDAQEFLRYLLEGLNEDLNRVRVRPRDHMQIDDNLSDLQKALESWKQYLRYDNSKIVDLFVGQFKSTLKCTFCDYCSTTFEVFWDLSLSFPKNIVGDLHIKECLETYTKKEPLDGDNMPTCSNCKVRRKCTKAMCIQKLPTILVLHLKRFNHNERYVRKLTNFVDFPLTNLDMSPYVDASVRSGTPLYDLYAIVNHSGTTHSGHYTAYCRPPHSDTWYHFNDARVTPIATRHIVSNEAYLLFYIQHGQFC